MRLWTFGAFRPSVNFTGSISIGNAPTTERPMNLTLLGVVASPLRESLAQSQTALQVRYPQNMQAAP